MHMLNFSIQGQYRIKPKEEGRQVCEFSFLSIAYIVHETIFDWIHTACKTLIGYSRQLTWIIGSLTPRIDVIRWKHTSGTIAAQT